jgi:hypothetical protein
MNLRSKTKQVLEKGEAERRSVDPVEGTLPVKLYNYWASRTPSDVPERENFCHYWRVILFWAPMYFLGEKFLNFVSTTYGTVIMFLSILLSLALVFTTSSSITFAFLFIGLLLSGVVGIVSAMFLLDRKYSKSPILSEDEVQYARKGAVLGFVGSIPTLAVFYFVRGLMLVSRKIPKPSKRVVKYAERSVLTFCLIALTLVLGLGIYELFIGIGWWTVAVILGVPAAILGFGTFLMRAEEKHDKQRRAEQEARWEYFDIHGEFPTPPAKKPGTLKKIYHGFLDLVVFVFQVIRTKKWKICPYVDVPKDPALTDK